VLYNIKQIATAINAMNYQNILLASVLSQEAVVATIKSMANKTRMVIAIVIIIVCERSKNRIFI